MVLPLSQWTRRAKVITAVGAAAATMVGLFSAAGPYLPVTREVMVEYVTGVVKERGAIRDKLMADMEARLIKVMDDRDDRVKEASLETDRKISALIDASKLNNISNLETQLAVVQGQIKSANNDLIQLQLKKRDFPNDTFILSKEREMGDDIDTMKKAADRVACQLKLARGFATC